MVFSQHSGMVICCMIGTGTCIYNKTSQMILVTDCGKLGSVNAGLPYVCTHELAYKN